MTRFVLIGYVYRCQTCGARHTVEVAEPTELICSHRDNRPTGNQTGTYKGWLVKPPQGDHE